MRLPIFGFLLLVCLPVFGQSNSLTLDELHLKFFNSKKKYPASILRYDPDAFTQLLSPVVLQGKKTFSGTLTDDRTTAIVNLNVVDGKIINYRSREQFVSSQQHFAVHDSPEAPWSADDTVWYDGTIFRTSHFFRDNTGTIWLQEDEYQNQWHSVRIYIVGEFNSQKTVYSEPVEEGEWKTWSNNTLRKIETHHNNCIEGLMAEYDEHGVLLQRYYFNGRVGTYGSYYEYDTVSKVVITGSYSLKGNATGKWFTKYTDSTIASISWMGYKGDVDSIKTWSRSGKLLAVNYYYDSMYKGRKEFLQYSRNWNESGELVRFQCASRWYNDTVNAFFNESGQPILTEIQMGKRVQYKEWYTNGQLKIERYYVPDQKHNYVLRDSVYRTWSNGGYLMTESYYQEGIFTSQTVAAKPEETGISYMRGPAYIAIMQNRSTQGAWSKGVTVPDEILDSVGFQLEALNTFCHQDSGQLRFWGGSATIENIRKEQGIYRDSKNSTSYVLSLHAIEWVRVDSNHRIVTSDPFLNIFLDSLQLNGSKAYDISPPLRKKGKTVYDFEVHINWSDLYLDLFYVNRRLNQLQPGSDMRIRIPGQDPIASEIFYLPQGAKTTDGTLPITIIGIAPSAQTGRWMHPDGTIEPRDLRSFQIFGVYGNKDVQYLYYDRKEGLLHTYYGIDTGIYVNARR